MNNDYREYKNRPCLVCGENIDDMRKASAIPVGAGLARVMHDRCRVALEDEVAEYNVRKALQAGSAEGATVQATGSAEGAEAYQATPHEVINKPCIVCGKQVPRVGGAIVQLSDRKFPAHAKCKATLLEVVAQALDPSNLSENIRARSLT